MPQLVALEWDEGEARVAVASKSLDRTVVEQVFAIPLRAQLTAEDRAAAGESAESVGKRIAAALRERGIGHCDAVIALGRGDVELRQLQLPAATDEELPKMVQLQALMEFNELDETWPLDFMPIDGSDDAARVALAAAVPPRLVEKAGELCRLSGLKMKRLGLHSCEAAALLDRVQGPRPPQTRLLVELFSHRAELTVTCGGVVLLTRTTRLGDEPTAARNLSAEIRLTLSAAENHFPGRKVSGIALCGRGDWDAATVARLEKEISLPAELFDPFAGLALSTQLRAKPPETPGRFAAVLGMLFNDNEWEACAIDFLHPRLPAEPAAKRNKWKLAAVAAVLLALGYVGYERITYWQLEHRLEELQTRLAEADVKLNSTGDKNLAAVQQISKWSDSEIVCLERLRELSEHLPSGEKFALTHFTLMPATMSRGGRTFAKMQLQGHALNNKAIAELEEGLRARGLRVEGSKTSEDKSLPPYSLKFNITVLVGRESKRT